MESNSIYLFQEQINVTLQELTQTLTIEDPKRGFTLQNFDHQLQWIVQWKHPNNSEEYFEVEIWQDQAKYSIMGTHRKDEFTEVSGVEYFCLEGMTLSELLAEAPRLIEEIKSSINSAIQNN